MSAVTASVVDMSGTALAGEHEIRVQSNTGQCLPMPLPALGTQRIIQGNGTNVGTVISLQCPARHTLVGSDLTCVMGTNSTQWVGETYCKPYEDYGFRVAVVASIISSAIILLMSMAFITCCLLDCLKEEEKRKQEREIQLWHQQERVEQWEERSSRYSHKGRNNNNNTQDKGRPLWDSRGCGQDDEEKDTDCRCNQHYSRDVTDPSLASTIVSSPRPLPLPGHGHCQPLFLQNSALYQNIGPLHSPSSLQHPPHYQEPSQTPCQSLNSGQVKNSTLGPVDILLRQYGAGEKNMSSASRPTQEDLLRNNIQSTRDCSIRIISV